MLAQPPLVGRSAEMDRLAAQLSRATRGQGCTMFLAGEAGIGKTRLAHETLVLAREQDFLVLEGPCAGYFAHPFSEWMVLLLISAFSLSSGIQR
jgi:predicted ATPase